jgi:hypothetical protein
MPDNLIELLPRLRRLVMANHQLRQLPDELPRLFWSNRLQAVELTPAISGAGQPWLTWGTDAGMTALLSRLRDTLGVPCHSVLSRVFCGSQCPASARPGVIYIGFELFPRSIVLPLSSDNTTSRNGSSTWMDRLVTSQALEKYATDMLSTQTSPEPVVLFPQRLRVVNSTTLMPSNVLESMSAVLFEQVLYRPRFLNATLAATLYNNSAVRSQTPMSRASMSMDAVPLRFETFVNASGSSLTHDGFPLDASIPTAAYNSLLWLPFTAR